MSTIVISVKTPMTQAYAKQKLVALGNDKGGLQNLQQLFRDLGSGISVGTVELQTGAADPVGASGTVTLATVSVDDTVTIGKTVLTAKASPATENQFSQAGTNAQNATSLAAVINAHSVLGKLVRAVAVNAVVTVTALIKGEIGNYIALASSNGTRLAVSGSGYLASGAGGALEAATVYNAGL